MHDNLSKRNQINKTSSFSNYDNSTCMCLSFKCKQNKSRTGFHKVGDIASLGAILVSRGAITSKGAKGGRF